MIIQHGVKCSAPGMLVQTVPRARREALMHFASSFMIPSLMSVWENRSYPAGVIIVVEGKTKNRGNQGDTCQVNQEELPLFITPHSVVIKWVLLNDHLESSMGPA